MYLPGFQGDTLCSLHQRSVDPIMEKKGHFIYCTCKDIDFNCDLIEHLHMYMYMYMYVDFSSDTALIIRTIK